MSDKKKVLLVDDDPDFVEILKAFLGQDYLVFVATDGLEGVRKAAALKPDLIMMDVMMPKVSGIEMARMLNAEDETRHIPVIVLTASHAGSGVPDLFRQEANVRHFLSKLEPPEDIVALAKKLLSGG